MQQFGSKLYLIFILLVIFFLSWKIIDTKFIFHPPQYQVLTLLPAQEVPAWEASDSAQIADSQAILASQLTAKAYLVMDISSRTVLLEQNADVPLPPASTTKLMTALTALELYDLDEVVEVSTQAAGENDGGGLFPHERITVRDLIIGMLVSSANDSAYALAGHAVGGETHFLEQMNITAQKFHLQNTFFQNPAGYDDPVNLITARDLAILTLQVMKEPELLSWMGMKNSVVYNVEGNIRHFLFTTNDLLALEPRVIAGKTGTTELAGEVLVSIVDHQEHTLLIVIMGSQDRYTDTQLILRWVGNNVRWQQP